MVRKVTQYTEPTGWKHVQATYDNITSKLDELPGTKNNDLLLSTGLALTLAALR